MRATWAIGTAMGLVAAGAALAAIRPGAPDPDVPDVLIEGLNPGTTIEQYVAQLASSLRGADRDGDGLDAADVALARDTRRAQWRGGRIGQMLAYDLNGDFKVTREELNRAATVVLQYRARQTEETLAAYDGDRDGVITLAEMAVQAEEADRGDDRLGDLLALDPNRDGKLTATELRALAEQAFARVDADGDGKLSQAEHAAFAPRIRAIAMIRSAPRCVLPPIPANAKLVAVGVYDGQALASVAIGGQDQETNLTDVDIEPGPTPLYLVLTSYESMAWRLNGATDRVVRVLVSSSQSPQAADGYRRKPGEGATSRGVQLPLARRQISASGVIGVPADRVTIGNTRCPGYFSRSGDFSDSVNPATNVVLGVLKASLGRAPDAAFGSYSARRIALPSGKTRMAVRDSAPAPRGFDPAAWTEAVRFWPGGLEQVDPRRVVAEASVEPYSVLPSQMGLAQLVGSGALQQTGSDTFRVVRPIPRLPSSMGGAHSATLILAKGVPLPPGDPVHSCIVVEETGERIGPTCDMRARPPRAPSLPKPQ